MDDPATKDVSIGIVTANEDENLKNKYLSAIKISCGYTVLRFDLEKTITQLMEVLKKVRAKGRRKYIRVTTEGETNTTLNLPINGAFVNGHVRDVSVVGISCTLEGNPDIGKNALIKDIQIKLQSALLKAEGTVLGFRMEGGERIYVILFTQRIDPDVRTKIRMYIQRKLQHKMDPELK
jgi:hypothetical protein